MNTLEGLHIVGKDLSLRLKMAGIDNAIQLKE
jgi:hypothetical protein